ncbi:MAG TPA: hypothetical protein VFV92_13985 [Candidatus Bathyarchaeia archaeon]|nr:hypothetical protein [Candidatus Bathyarchaeia archaeon]
MTFGVMVAAVASLVIGAVVYAPSLIQNSPVCTDPSCISSHVYNPSRLETIKARIVASGIVEAKREEADGDYHILVQLDPQYANLTNQANVHYQNGWLVVEIICALPVTQQDAIAPCQGYASAIPIPDVGQHITFSGPYVLDSEHYYWAEVHPVYSLTIG